MDLNFEQFRVYLHRNMESLYETFDKSLLPIDLGGFQKSIKEINDLWFEELLVWRDWFLIEEKSITEEMIKEINVFDIHHVSNLLEITNASKKTILWRMRLNNAIKKRIVDDIAEWIERQPHLCHIKPDRRLIECLFIRSNKRIERTKHTLDLYYAMKAQAPELFKNRDPAQEDFTMPFEGISFTILRPRSFFTGYRVMIMKFCKNTRQFSTNNFFKIMLMIFEIVTRYDYVSGFIFIWNCEEMIRSHLAKLDLLAMRKTVFVLQNIFLIQIKEFHVVGSPAFANPIIQTFTSSAHLRLRTIFHPHIDNVLEYLREHGYDPLMDPEMLQMDMNTKQELWFRELLNFRNWFIEDDKYAADESKRPYELKLDFV